MGYDEQWIGKPTEHSIGFQIQQRLSLVALNV